MLKLILLTLTDKFKNIKNSSLLTEGILEIVEQFKIDVRLTWKFDMELKAQSVGVHDTGLRCVLDEQRHVAHKKKIT